MIKKDKTTDYEIARTPITPETEMRNAVIDRLYDISTTNKKIMFITADMGAKALDRWRRDRLDQYRDVGIAEQALASIAAGMAKEGMKVFIYAIAPFVTTRIHEFHKINAGIMKIPYTTIGVGTGFSYSDSGPTHYNTEDIGLMRIIPNMEILSPTDSVMAADMAEYATKSRNPIYLRLERSVQPIITKNGEDLSRGFRELIKGEKTCIISTGNMVHDALEVSRRFKEKRMNIGVIDLYRIKPIKEEFVDVIKKYRNIVTLEEHLLAGGLGSIIAETLTDRNIKNRLERVGINDKYVYLYGRENIKKQLGIDVDSVYKKVSLLDNP